MSRKNFPKAQRELALFTQFTERCPVGIDPLSIANGSDPPDIYCQFGDGESVGFELKELCYQPTAHAIGQLLKTKDQEAKYIRDPDLSDLIGNALKDQYETKYPTELLFFLDG